RYSLFGLSNRSATCDSSGSNGASCFAKTAITMTVRISTRDINPSGLRQIWRNSPNLCEDRDANPPRVWLSPKDAACPAIVPSFLSAAPLGRHHGMTDSESADRASHRSDQPGG